MSILKQVICLRNKKTEIRNKQIFMVSFDRVCIKIKLNFDLKS